MIAVRARAGPAPRPPELPLDDIAELEQLSRIRRTA
jgi:hypothetical protein